MKLGERPQAGGSEAENKAVCGQLKEDKQGQRGLDKTPGFIWGLSAYDAL